MLGVWADYSGGRPGGAALRAAGITGVVRYVGVGGAGKRLTAVEYADLVAHGIQVAAVVEASTTDADGGYNAGVLSAGAAQHDLAVQTAGLPPIEVVFAANDKPTFVQADVDYVRGFRDVFSGAAVVGPYGFGSFLAACSAAGLAPVAWQAGPAPSRTGTTGVATFWQRQGGPVGPADGPTAPTTQTINGVVCDLNNQLLPLPGGIDVTQLDDIQAAIGDVREQLCGHGCRTTGYTGWAQLGNKTMVDGLAGVASQVGAIQTAEAAANTAAGAAVAALQATLAKILAAQQAGETVTLDATQLATVTAQLEAALPSYTVSIAPKA